MRELNIPACRVTQQPSGKFSVELPPGARERAQNLFEYCFKKHGGFIGLKMIPPRRKRSTGKNSSNSHLNGHIQQFAVDTGENFDIVKLKVKQMGIDRGYPILEDENGVPARSLLTGWPMGISEADSSPEECSLLIEAIHQLAGEYGVFLVEDLEKQ